MPSATHLVAETAKITSAGAAERGGEGGFVLSGGQMGGGGHLRVAGTVPQLLVAVVVLGVAGNVAGDDFGSRRSRVKTNPRLQGTARHVVRYVGPLGTR